jgi:hypothetical protein
MLVPARKIKKSGCPNLSTFLMNVLEQFFTQADQLFFDQIQEEAIESDTLRKAASTNSKDDFRYVFDRAFEDLSLTAWMAMRTSSGSS